MVGISSPWGPTATTSKAAVFASARTPGGTSTRAGSRWNNWAWRSQSSGIGSAAFAFAFAEGRSTGLGEIGPKSSSVSEPWPAKRTSWRLVVLIERSEYVSAGVLTAEARSKSTSFRANVGTSRLSGTQVVQSWGLTDASCVP